MFDNEIIYSSSPKRIMDTNKLRRSKRKHYSAFDNEDQENFITKKIKSSSNQINLNTFEDKFFCGENNIQRNNQKFNDFLTNTKSPLENCQFQGKDKFKFYF